LKIADVNLLYLHMALPWGVTPLAFRSATGETGRRTDRRTPDRYITLLGVNSVIKCRIDVRGGPNHGQD